MEKYKVVTFTSSALSSDRLNKYYDEGYKVISVTSVAAKQSGNPSSISKEWTIVLENLDDSI